MDGVGTPIIGRPRPLPGHDTPNPAYHPHTLNYEEPLYVIVGATALTVVIGVVLLIVGPCGHKHRSARSRKIRK